MRIWLILITSALTPCVLGLVWLALVGIVTTIEYDVWEWGKKHLDLVTASG